MISKADQALLSKKGISAEQVAEQLKTFKTGFPFLKLEGAATIGKGVLNPSQEEIEEYLTGWDNYCAGGNAILKFVPASPTTMCRLPISRRSSSIMSRSSLSTVTSTKCASRTTSFL